MHAAHIMHGTDGTHGTHDMHDARIAHATHVVFNSFIPHPQVLTYARQLVRSHAHDDRIPVWRRGL